MAFKFKQFAPKVPSTLVLHVYEEVYYRAVLEINENISPHEVIVEVVTTQRDVHEPSGAQHSLRLHLRGPIQEKNMYVYGTSEVLISMCTFDFSYRAKLFRKEKWTLPPTQPEIHGMARVLGVDINKMAPILKNQPNFSHIIGPLYIGDSLTLEQIPYLEFTHVLCVDGDIQPPWWVNKFKPKETPSRFHVAVKKTRVPISYAHGVRSSREAIIPDLDLKFSDSDISMLDAKSAKSAKSEAKANEDKSLDGRHKDETTQSGDVPLDEIYKEETKPKEIKPLENKEEIIQSEDIPFGEVSKEETKQNEDKPLDEVNQEETKQNEDKPLDEVNQEETKQNEDKPLEEVNKEETIQNEDKPLDEIKNNEEEKPADELTDKKSKENEQPPNVAPKEGPSDSNNNNDFIPSVPPREGPSDSNNNNDFNLSENVETIEVNTPKTNEPDKPDAPLIETIEIPETVEIGQPEIGQPGIDQPEKSKPEIGMPEVGVPEIGMPEIGVPELAVPELSKPELSKPELSKRELSKPESSKTEIGQSILRQSEFGKAQASKTSDRKSVGILSKHVDSSKQEGDSVKIDDTRIPSGMQSTKRKSTLRKDDLKSQKSEEVKNPVLYKWIPYPSAPDKRLDESIIKETVQWLNMSWYENNSILIVSNYGFLKSGMAALAFTYANNRSRSFKECYHMIDCRRPIFYYHEAEATLKKIFRTPRRAIGSAAESGV